MTIAGSTRHLSPNTETGSGYPQRGANVDFDMFGVKEIRDVLKSKAHCLRAGFPPHHQIINTLNEIKAHYIQRVGLPTYLSQMLGDVSTAPVEQCRLYAESGAPIEIFLNGSRHQPLLRFIARKFPWDKLPARVEVDLPGKPDQTQIRFL